MLDGVHQYEASKGVLGYSNFAVYLPDVRTLTFRLWREGSLGLLLSPDSRCADGPVVRLASLVGLREAESVETSYMPRSALPDSQKIQNTQYKQCVIPLFRAHRNDAFARRCVENTNISADATRSAGVYRFVFIE